MAASWACMVNPMLLLCEKQREPCVPKDTTDWLSTILTLCPKGISLQHQLLAPSIILRDCISWTGASHVWSVLWVYRWLSATSGQQWPSISNLLHFPHKGMWKANTFDNVVISPHLPLGPKKGYLYIYLDIPKGIFILRVSCRDESKTSSCHARQAGLMLLCGEHVLANQSLCPRGLCHVQTPVHEPATAPLTKAPQAFREAQNQLSPVVHMAPQLLS